jgi:ribosomal protein L37AE/L43A
MINFILGALTVLLIIAVFSSREQVEFEVELEEIEPIEDSKRFVTLSCQTCRKLKRHQEIANDIYQCTKCKRYVDLRREIS